jgi:hypothetical protein
MEARRDMRSRKTVIAPISAELSDVNVFQTLQQLVS